ncbi:hypothetical protein PENARI_c036G02375 [Penicillium arizonense]|uniref:Uncharacterized protein n=1 Tax=Penicillium arizonense TaxID=1835702 RepID=A0A1F5L4J4_PENAI|nr:hypothetical protein PENARI_c036G02375 [Penicillium arizonense]OGE47831.1 hypothetical protein PENARI_c036G02375 [Penicillium arizonense]
MDGMAFVAWPLPFVKSTQFTPDLIEYLSGNQGFKLSGYSDSFGWEVNAPQKTARILNGSDIQADGSLVSGYSRVFRTGLEDVMRNVAASLTTWALQHNADNFNGTALLPEVYVDVHWPWLALPAALIVLSIVFLGLTMLLNTDQGRDLWKTSALPVLKHGL